MNVLQSQLVHGAIIKRKDSSGTNQGVIEVASAQPFSMDRKLNMQLNMRASWQRVRSEWLGLRIAMATLSGTIHQRVQCPMVLSPHPHALHTTSPIPEPRFSAVLEKHQLCRPCTNHGSTPLSSTHLSQRHECTLHTWGGDSILVERNHQEDLMTHISADVACLAYWPLAVSPVFVAKNDPHFGVLEAHVFQAMKWSSLSCRDSASSLLIKT